MSVAQLEAFPNLFINGQPEEQEAVGVLSVATSEAMSATLGNREFTIADETAAEFQVIASEPISVFVTSARRVEGAADDSALRRESSGP